MSSLLAALETRTREELIDTCLNLLHINKRLTTQTHPEWIRVTDAMPDNEREVLVTSGSSFFGVAFFIEGHWEVAEYGELILDVTHWTELPEKPEEEL